MIYKDNATLGIGKLDYIIASGIKQRNLQDQLYLENFLHLEQITPMQTSYTQTAEDRAEEENPDEEKDPNKKTGDETSKDDSNSDIEPSDKKEVKDDKSSGNTKEVKSEE
jgi:hypothetical protein